MRSFFYLFQRKKSTKSEMNDPFVIGLKRTAVMLDMRYKNEEEIF